MASDKGEGVINMLSFNNRNAAVIKGFAHGMKDNYRVLIGTLSEFALMGEGQSGFAKGYALAARARWLDL